MKLLPGDRIIVADVRVLAGRNQDGKKLWTYKQDSRELT